MSDNKPPQIPDHEWTQTPPAVRALLSQSLHRLKTIEEQQNYQTPDDDGATIYSPYRAGSEASQSPIVPSSETASAEYDSGTSGTVALPSVAEDGGTVILSPDGDDDGGTVTLSTAGDDGGTVALPLADEGGTVALPPADDGGTVMLPSDDDGGTVALPSDDDGGTVALAGDDGGTVALPSAAEEITAAASFGDTAPMNEGATSPSPAARSVTDKPHLSTFDLRAEQIAKRNKAADPLADIHGTPTRGKSTQPLPVVSADNQQLERQEIILQERYQLQQILGKGGFGAAYLAEDIKLKRSCVVKQMLSPQHISPRELEKLRLDFEREGSLLVQLNQPGHPNIPEIFDYFSNENGSYLAMKYIQGQSLDQAIKSPTDEIEWRQAVRYIIDVCSALNYMHTQGEQPVMHRDIKPGNILLGDDGRIWLVDFGLAKTEPVADSADSVEMNAAGSAGYTPLEQWLGQAVPASDIYAVGVTLHHLVTKVSPLDAFREDGQVKVNIVKLQDLHSRLDPIRKINRDLPRELDEVIVAATAAEPEQRPTALQLQQQLEVLVSGAQDAALFTFKNGQSAYTVGELVDLCEQNRVEAQGYLYRGDFERWFTLINRNDLAAAADTAVKHGEQKGRDGLEKFLRLIMPNLFWRRLSRATVKVSKIAALLLLIATLVFGALVISGTLATSWLLQQTIANHNWDYYALELDDDNLFTQTDLTDTAQMLTGAYLSDIQVSPQAPETLAVQANLGDSLPLAMPITLTLDDDNQPHFELTEVNGLSPSWVGNTIIGGVNTGIERALAQAPVDITSLAVTDGAVIMNVERNGRVAWRPPTPDPNFVPTSTPIPLPTPTPPGLALLAIFNELDQDVILEIDEQSWLISARDTEVIEQEPGSYRYKLRYAANGLLAAEGYRDWTYRAYRWRITTDGTVIE